MHRAMQFSYFNSVRKQKDESEMVKHISRIVCLSLTFYLVALVVPGFDLTGPSPLLSAGILGVSLWGCYELAGMALRRYYGIVKGTCPMPRVMKIMMIWFLVLTVAFFFAAASSIIGLVTMTAFYWGLLASVAHYILGIALSGVMDRLILPLFGIE